MTKLRPPVSPEQALTQIAALLTFKRAGEIVGQEERTVRNWSDPDTPAEISYRNALKLDAAFLAAGGGFAPFRETYLQLLEDATAEACADVRRLAEHAATIAKEAGDAVAATIRAAQPGASAADRLIAARELQELDCALAKTLSDVRGPEVPPPSIESG